MKVDGKVCRKAIAFDLIQEELRKNYPKPVKSINPYFYKKAYKDLGKFFKERGFVHRQGSIYHSRDMIHEYDALKIIREAGQKFSWLKQCVNEIDITDIGMTYSVKHLLFVKEAGGMPKEKPSFHTKENDDICDNNRMQQSQQQIIHSQSVKRMRNRKDSDVSDLEP